MNSGGDHPVIRSQRVYCTGGIQLEYRCQGNPDTGSPGVYSDSKELLLLTSYRVPPSAVGGRY